MKKYVLQFDIRIRLFSETPYWLNLNVHRFGAWDEVGEIFKIEQVNSKGEHTRLPSGERKQKFKKFISELNNFLNNEEQQC